MKKNHQGRLVRVVLVSLVLSISLVLGTSAAWAIVVTNTNDSGPGSLRQAIWDADDGVPTPITFAVSGTIYIKASKLPELTDSGDTIDASGNTVVLDGSFLNGSQDGLRIWASNITIRGLTIQNFPRDGIRVGPPTDSSNQTVTGVVISHNTIQGNGQDGLRVSGQTGDDETKGGNTVSATIANNQVIRNGDDGIVVFGGLTSTVGNNVRVVISNNIVRGSRGVKTGGTRTGDGIRVLGSGSDAGGANCGNNTVIATISHNRVEDNVDDGIMIGGTGNGPGSNNKVFVEITNNLVRKSGAVSSTRGVGIGFRGGSQETAVSVGMNNSVTFVAADNNIQESKDQGINVGGGLGSAHSLSGIISNNAIDRSGVNGIRLTAGSGTYNRLQDIQVLENQVSRSGEDGIFVNGGSGEGAILSEILIKGNESNNNGRHGIGVFQGSGAGNSVSVAGITDNETRHNAQDGILISLGVPGSGATPISANRANNNGQDGIDINDTGYVVLANTANNNVVAGIDAIGNIDGSRNTATRNTTCNTPGCF